MTMLIKHNKSIIPSCDVEIGRLGEIVKATADIPEVGAYKLGFVISLSAGLGRAVDEIRKYTNKPIIYDHQKAGADIPSTGTKFARVCKEAGVDAVVLFPQAGPVAQKEWIEAMLSEKLRVIVGAAMAHPSFTQSEGGYVADEAIDRIYQAAADQGVVDFVFPGTRPALIERARALLDSRGILPTIYSTGLGIEKTDMQRAYKVSGNRWHAIIGRAIYDAPDIRSSVNEFVSTIKDLEV